MTKELAPIQIPVRTWQRLVNLADMLHSDTMSVISLIVNEAWRYTLCHVRDSKQMKRKFYTRYQKNLDYEENQAHEK